MILTCPNCATRYVVKDGSIGPKGRKVRCANCQHSWHQDADPATLVEETPLGTAAVDEGAPPADPPAVPPEPVADPQPDTPPPGPPFESEPSAVADDAPVAIPPIPEEEAVPDPPVVPDAASGYDEPDAQPADDHPAVGDITVDKSPARDSDPGPDVHAPEVEPMAAAEPEPVSDESTFTVADEIYEDEDEPKKRWPLVALIGLLAVAVAAAALVAFGPPELRERIGLAQAEPAQSPFTLMFEQRSIVPLEGTDSQRISVRGRIINATDSEQVVPIIHARVTDGAGALVESWTIDPPQPRLGPGESASFNNARVGEFPEDATLTLAVGNSAN